jgi:uncharacterized membrane protein
MLSHDVAEGAESGRKRVQRSANDKPRLEAIDLARGLALVAMAIYHFAWDLEFFGYAPPGMTAQGGWKLFARCIASSFLFLVGVSLFLGHAKGIRWASFLRRLAMVAGAAAAISLVTWIAVPGGFIFFGILHHIALASLLGLAFLRLPAAVTVLIAIAVIVAPQYLRSTAFDHPGLWWVGLSSVNPRSNDYVPLFPWFGAVLLGIASARVAKSTGLLDRIGEWQFSRLTRPVQGAGRHSLAFYLVHQPVLIGAIWLFSQAMPAAEAPRDVQFTRACSAQCGELQDEAFCQYYCACVRGTLEDEGRFDEVDGGTLSTETSQRLQEVVSACSVDAELATMGEDSE